MPFSAQASRTPLFPEVSALPHAPKASPPEDCDSAYHIPALGVGESATFSEHGKPSL